MKKIYTIAISLVLLMFNPTLGFATEEKFSVDSSGKHAYIQFKISHFGFSYVLGHIKTFKAIFCYDPETPNQARINVTIDTSRVDTGHSTRDRHVRSSQYLDAKKFSTASFSSTNYEEQIDGTGTVTGDLNLHGITKSLTIKTRKLGSGNDPWGGYRSGFEGWITLNVNDFGLEFPLGDDSSNVELYFSFEGIRNQYVECPA